MREVSKAAYLWCQHRETGENTRSKCHGWRLCRTDTDRRAVFGFEMASRKEGRPSSYFSLSLGLMATREPRSQIAPNWPSVELGSFTRTTFMQMCSRQVGSGAGPRATGDRLGLPAEVVQVALIESDVFLGALWNTDRRIKRTHVPSPRLEVLFVQSSIWHTCRVPSSPLLLAQMTTQSSIIAHIILTTTPDGEPPAPARYNKVC